MTLRSVVRATHPLPTAGVTLISLLLAVVWGLDGARVALVVATILTNQLSIGLSNDAIDAPRDRAVGRADKPVARGELTVTTAWAVAAGCAAASLALGAALGPLSAAANALFLAAGWLYNVGLKRTVWSIACYAIGFAAFPTVVMFAVTPAVQAGWAAPLAGGLLGVAAHVANALPDLDEDRATHIRGFPHRLSIRANAIVVGACLAGASLVLLTELRPPVAIIIGAAVVALGLSAAATMAIGLHPRSRATFALVFAAAVLAVALLAVSGSALR
jgi:4-hydroxybenzoate polyprenyltransferase